MQTISLFISLNTLNKAKNREEEENRRNTIDGVFLDHVF